MNIEIANRLAELRKKSGLSQEQLAEKLGLSRQAVSKWERAEASPDTDNLICLAKLYNVSLDDLLDTEQPVDDIVRNVKEQQAEEDPIKAEKVNPEEAKGIHIEDDGDKIHITEDGIYVREASGAYVNINKEGIKINEDDIPDTWIKGNHGWWVPNHKIAERNRKLKIAEGVVAGCLAILVTAVYIILGCLFDGVWPYPLVWPIGWILYLLIPFSSSIFDSIRKRRLQNLTGAIVMLAVASFMILGMGFNLWHPGWVVFLAVPLYSIVAGAIDRAMRASRHKSDFFVSDSKIKSDED